MMTRCQVWKVSKVHAILSDVFTPPFLHFFPRVWAEPHAEAPFSLTPESISHTDATA